MLIIVKWCLITAWICISVIATFGVPFILGGSQIILKIIDRFPIIVYAGGALLGWIAGTLMVDDPGILAHLPNLPALHTEGGIAGAVFVLLVAFVLKYVRSKKTKA